MRLVVEPLQLAGPGVRHGCQRGVLPPASLPPPSVNSAAARADPPGPALDPGPRHRPSLFPDGVGPGGPTAGLNSHFAAMAAADQPAVCPASRRGLVCQFPHGRTGLCSPPAGGLRVAARPLRVGLRGPAVFRGGPGHQTQREIPPSPSSLGPPEIPAPELRRIYWPVNPALPLGSRPLSAVTSPRPPPLGRDSGGGLQMDPYPVSLLARPGSL